MIAAKLGNLFEVGFNIGILTCIKQNNIAHNFGESYSLDLQKTNFSQMVENITKTPTCKDKKIEKSAIWELANDSSRIFSGNNCYYQLECFYHY